MNTSSSLISTLSINRLELPINIGWPEEERAEKQIVFVDINFSFPALPSAFQNDDLKDTICYQTLIENIRQFVQHKYFRLVEHFCYELHQFIKTQYAVPAYLSVQIRKYPCINGLTEGVTVSCTDG